MSDEDRIGRVARALCVADGKDPDKVVRTGTEDVEMDPGFSYDRDIEAPAWTTYAGQTRRFIAAARALGLLE